jgi:FG-GAP-like repeat
VSTSVISSSGSGIVFDNTFDTTVTAAYESAAVAAERLIESEWTNSVTIVVDFTAAALGQNGGLASNDFNVVDVSYSQLKSALAAHQFSSYAQAAVASLPASNPAGGNTEWSLPTAYARMLGLTSASGTPDITVTLNTSYPWNYGQDVINTLTHEISEGGMGRIGGLGDQNSLWSTMDLFRYSSAGVRDYTDGRDRLATYFSYDGTNLSSSAGLSFNNEFRGSTQVNTEDTADFNQLDVFGTGEPGETFGLSQTDLEMMDVLGWDPAPPSSAPSNASPPTFDASWTIAGAGDVNGDGSADLIWANQATNLAEIQLQAQGAPAGGGVIPNSPFDSSWSVVATGDFNGDGLTDLVYRHAGDGVVEIQFLNGLAGAGGGAISNNPFDTTWNIVTAGDFNGDGDSDLVWQQPASGLVEIQLLQGNASVGGGLIANNPFSAGWKIVAAGDFDGNGSADLAWQNQSTGLVELQFLSGSTAIGGGAIDNNPFGAGWSVVAAGDFLGNGFDDLVYQRQADGLVEIQYLNGNTAVGGGEIANSSFGSGWQVVGAGDFNGDGKADLLYRNVTTATTEVQLLNGTAPIGGGVLALG